MLPPNTPQFPALASTVAILLSVHGLRKKSLSPSGALAAVFVGVVMLGIPNFRTPGITMIVFYLLASRATKAGSKLKSKLEEGNTEAGCRNAIQVLCNSFTALLATSLWAAKFSPQSIHAFALRNLFPGWYDGFSGAEFQPKEWCVLSENTWSRTLLFVVLGHFGTCLGDTLASELGILSTSPPRLITTFRKVPPGTNGGMSALGTACSVAGGAAVGLTFSLCLVFENPACLTGESVGISNLLYLVAWGALSGALGSGIDSLLGATVQRTRYSTKSKFILQDHTKNDSPDVKTISGLNILTNNQVNLVSSAVTACVLGWMA